MRPQPHESGSHGVSPLKELTEEERSGLEDLIRALFFQVEAVEIRRRDADDCDAIVDVSFDESREDASGAPGYPARTQATIRQTVLYCSRPELKLPAFTAGPMTGLVGAVMRRALESAGMPIVHLPAYADFNQRFTVMSFQPDWTRKLFAQPVVDAISAHGELTVATATGRIAVYRKGHTVPQSERERFFAAAREIADRIIESAAALPPELTTGGQQAMQTIQTMGGWLGNRLQAWVVSSQEVNDFLAQTPPRVAPARIRKCVYGASGVTMLWGAGFMALGTILVSCMLIVGVEGKDGGPAPAWFPYVFALFPLLGAVVLFFATLYRRRRRRILRDGLCEIASVVKVEGTCFHSDSGRQHDVTFETTSGRVVVRVGGGPASLASKRQERGETVRLLVDPHNPSRALWIEGWAMDAYE